MEQPILEMRGITKKYPGVTALNNVSLSFKRGEVHAIVGENGAGKSTFIKTISGAISPTSGELYFNGQKIENNTPSKAIELGIGVVYQELNLLKYLTVAENIYYNRSVMKHGLIDYKATCEKAQKTLDLLGVDINPKTTVKDLTVGYQQLVEIAKAISREVKLLILDEPSAPLTNNEMKYLYQIIRTLKEKGIAIIYISHRLEEVFELCDRVSVFRDGQFIKTMDVQDTDKDELIRLMVNRSLSATFPDMEVRPEKRTVMEVKNLCTPMLKNISFSIKSGERLGFAGLVGAGRTEMARAIFGADPINSGEVFLNGKKINIRSPKDAIRLKIAYLPEDRKRYGVFLKMSVADNILFSKLSDLTNALGLINSKKAKDTCDEQIKALSIKTPSPDALISNLSGGNQQKAIIAKWLLMNSEIIFFDEPTRGIDVGAKQEIYKLINALAEQGKAIVIISSEMLELLGMSDRVIVMHEGSITGELTREEATQEKVLRLASGVC